VSVFKSVELLEQCADFYKLKVPRGEVTIGYLFGMIEDLKTDFNISEYSVTQTSLEQMLIQVRQAVDNNGKKIRLVPRQLIVSPGNIFQAEVLLKSVLRAGNANNDINPVRSIGLLDEGAAVLSRLTSSTAWWVQTDAPEGFKLLMRRRLEKTMEGDFETDTMRYKATERYDIGFTDPRCAYGTPGV